MQVRSFDDAERFLEHAGPLLESDEARHNLIFGICSLLKQQPDAYAGFRSWVIVDGAPAAAAIHTPPWNAVVARPKNREALERLAEAMHEDGTELPGVGGAVPEVDQFVELWKADAGVRAEPALGQRIHRLTHVRPVAEPPGRMREAGDDDRALLIEWARSFVEESFDEAAPERGPGVADGMVDRRVGATDAGLVIWEIGGKPASFAGFGGPTPNGIRVGPVYTPPEFRNRGYATALVARLSERLLKEGRRFCFLYTDLANPTSNSIYAKIGYEPVCDARTYRFEQPRH